MEIYFKISQDYTGCRRKLWRESIEYKKYLLYDNDEPIVYIYGVKIETFHIQPFVKLNVGIE